MDWKNNDGAGAEFSWSRSFSEPDLAASHKHRDRFAIGQPHEYIAVDDLKFFRRRQPVQLHTHSNFCLYNSAEPTVAFGSLKSEYSRNYCCKGHGDARPPRTLLRRATSLRLEGLMQLLSEHQDKYHWYTAEDLQFARTYPVRNPESWQLGGTHGDGNMKSSSYLSHPMVDSSAQILPRDMFRDDKEPSNRLASDKFKRDVAAREQNRCHLQMRAEDTQYEPTPSEYKRQYVEQFPIEKAHSIPQISSIRMQGEFHAVPEYQDSFKMYANYSKSAPIKKHDNLRISGAEQEPSEASGGDLPEYRDKFNVPPKHMAKEKSLKTDDHLRPRGEFTKEVPEYYESFRDPHITEMPERGKVREPCLRLRGKIEFNPEYSNNYLDFPRARPVLRKPVSSFRLPTTSTTNTNTNTTAAATSPQLPAASSMTANELTATPEYRRAQYNYQLRERERERPRELNAAPAGNLRKSSDSSLDAGHCPLQSQAKRRPSRQRQLKETPPAAPSFEDVATGGSKKPPRYGRRGSVQQNASKCRDKSSIIEGNPKYAAGCRRQAKQSTENQQGSFLVLEEPCKPSNWMKKTWYDS
ncbi:uncharacterized protein [Drosophila virilis]|uniref:Uncharacterized protein n=1 Tax=Drosophila virilis TaxID=7244 RepID=B4LKS4_DROVI|nr:uncharacterized protein LOC6626620 [Drosophila virilis]EDW61797.2 uncharacterized protein Dvir_GJ20110 [Drosophila virilis]